MFLDTVNAEISFNIILHVGVCHVVLLELMSPNIAHEHKCITGFFLGGGRGHCLVLIDGNEWLHGLVHNYKTD